MRYDTARSATDGKRPRGCENCAMNAPDGDGNHACTAYRTRFVVLERRVPSTRYLRCNGRKWAAG